MSYAKKGNQIVLLKILKKDAGFFQQGEGKMLSSAHFRFDKVALL